jgi:hypothetical protein
MNDKPTIRFDSQRAVQPEPTEAQLIDRKLQEAGVLLQLEAMNAKKHKCWRRGQTAKENGFARISPYYEDAGADAAWFAGYDGADEPTLDAVLVPVLDEQPISAS